MVTTNYVGKKIVSFGEYLVGRIPIVSKVYKAAKQLLEAFAFKEKEAGGFLGIKMRTIYLFEQKSD